VIFAPVSLFGRSNVDAPSVLRCGIELLQVKIRLRLVGFHSTLRYSQRRRHRVEDSPETPALVARTALHVAIAGALFPGRVRCLEQSFALLRLLYMKNVPVSLQVGVQPYRFRAHAWVEYRGLPINEPGDGISGFTRLPQLPL
jgi:hypothetical protein